MIPASAASCSAMRSSTAILVSEQTLVSAATSSVSTLLRPAPTAFRSVWAGVGECLGSGLGVGVAADAVREGRAGRDAAEAGLHGGEVEGVEHELDAA